MLLGNIMEPLISFVNTTTTTTIADVTKVKEAPASI